MGNGARQVDRVLGIFAILTNGYLSSGFSSASATPGDPRGRTAGYIHPSPRHTGRVEDSLKPGE